jgi:hypothetical protein
VDGRFLAVLPQVTSHFSHGMPTSSAEMRWQSNTDSVPRLPMPDWMLMRPSGLITIRPSKPMDPAEYALTATPTPRTLDPLRWPLRAFRSSHRNNSAPLSSACFRKALVAYGRRPLAFAAPNVALPSGALMR